MTPQPSAPVVPVPQKIKSGFLSSLRSAAYFVGASIMLLIFQQLWATFHGCQTALVPIFKCRIDWNGLAYAAMTSALIGAARFVEGYLTAAFVQPSPPHDT